MSNEFPSRMDNELLSQMIHKNIVLNKNYFGKMIIIPIYEQYIEQKVIEITIITKYDKLIKEKPV